MTNSIASLKESAPDTYRFYRHALEVLAGENVPFLIGGAYAFGRYTGIDRFTRDLDVFLKPTDVGRVLGAFTDAGYRAEVVYSHWLAKVYHGDGYVDVIYNSGNAICPVDDLWFDRAEAGEALGAKVRFIPAEEMIWQKAYIMERERFDGADVIHVIRARGRELDWDRLMTRFGPHWRVLLSHLVLFGFVYPDDRESIPTEVMRVLTARVHEPPEPTTQPPVCGGTLLSRAQYLADTEQWGYTDPRQAPLGPMTVAQLVAWTDPGRCLLPEPMDGRQDERSAMRNGEASVAGG